MPLALAAPSGAAVKTGLDRHAGLRLSLNGRVLTAELVRPNSEEELFGKRIDAVCSSSFLHARRDRVVRTRLWPAGKPRMSFRFRRQLTDPARWCLLEHRAADVAFVSFLEPEPFRFVGKGRGPSGAWWRLGGGSD